MEKDIITETNKVFSVTDKLFSMWIARIYGGFPIMKEQEYPGAGAGPGAFCYCVAGYSSLYTFIPLTRASGESGELERRQFLREFFHTFLYAFHSPSAGLVPSVQVVPELGLIHSGDALESGK